MGDLIFVAVVVAFFAVTLAYLRGCEWIVGSDPGVEPGGAPTGDDATGAGEGRVTESGTTR
jgi:hypothetical protein